MHFVEGSSKPCARNMTGLNLEYNQLYSAFMFSNQLKPKSSSNDSAESSKTIVSRNVHQSGRGF